ncbi:MAG: hypothetical protein EAS52_07725 [Parapedobacter sp.]|nr:MAG: hypothetical protein EAS52_07725 [Parapedobacter sp.]
MLRRSIIPISFSFFFIIISTISHASQHNFSIYAKEYGVLQSPVSSSDSTAADKAEADLQKLKKHVKLSEEQKESVRQLFLGKHQYLEALSPTGPRAELVMRTKSEKLKEIIGEAYFDSLKDLGLIDWWFRLDGRPL